MSFLFHVTKWFAIGCNITHTFALGFLFVITFMTTAVTFFLLFIGGFFSDGVGSGDVYNVLLIIGFYIALLLIASFGLYLSLQIINALYHERSRNRIFVLRLLGVTAITTGALLTIGSLDTADNLSFLELGRITNQLGAYGGIGVFAGLYIFYLAVTETHFAVRNYVWRTQVD